MRPDCVNLRGAPHCDAGFPERGAVPGKPVRESGATGRSPSALIVWDLEIAGESLPNSGAVSMPPRPGGGDCRLLLYGPRFPDSARAHLARRFPVTLTVGKTEEQARRASGWATMTSLREEGNGYVLRLEVSLDV